MVGRLPGAQQLRLRENQLFLALSIIIGILAGLAAVLFSLTIDLASDLFFDVAPSPWRLLFVPILVSIVTGVLLARYFPEVRGSGVPQTRAALQLQNGVIPARVPIGRFLVGVLTIGAGHSLGREGPSVQLGAGIASGIGRWLRLPADRVKALVPVGVAGALSAAFNTPVAAVLFTLEEIIGDMNATVLGSAVIASVSAAIVQRSILGNDPLFRVPVYDLVHPGELAGYALLGVVCGLVSIVFSKGLLALRAWFKRLPRSTVWVQPAMGGAVIGVFLLLVPEVKGVGYEFVDQVLNGGLVWRTMLLLCAMKLVATIVSYSSGNAGGIFAPSLYIGAMAGGALGVLLNEVALFPTGAPGAYALVGMGAVFAGIVRAPMTSVFMIFELTQDYQIFVPLMVANLLSYAISRRYQPMPIYHALLEQDGIHLPSPTMRGASATWTARDLMRVDAALLAPGLSIAAARDAVAGGQRSHLVGTRERLVGSVTADQIEAAFDAGRHDETVGTLVDKPAVHAHPDHSLEVVFDRLAQGGGVLAIVSRDDVRRVEGIVTSEEISRFIETGRRLKPTKESAPKHPS